jgi:aryl-alcohol dehydrogenase-like predicted oxidoreductase
MYFGTNVSEQDAFAVLDRFVELGGRWIDTADCYSFWVSDTGFGGQSEAVLGRWLRSRPDVREQVLLSTKVGSEPTVKGDWPASRKGLSAAAVREAFAGSLDRLGVDRVDLLWAHMEDRDTPIEETAEAMAGLVTEGTVGRLGTSNHPAWRIERARAHTLARGLEPFSAIQHSRSYLLAKPGMLPERQSTRFGELDDELVDYATEHALDVWAYTPLLSGAYDDPAKPLPDSYDHPVTVERLATLDSVAAEHGATRGQVVLAWLVANGVTPILGGSKVHQVDAAIEGVRLELTSDQLERLGGLSPVF